jgi:hypothetical protein
MSERFASGQKAIAECDVCGFQYRLRELRPLVVKMVVTGIKACPECTGYPQSRARIQPVDPLFAFGHIGYVTIVIT